MNVNLEKVNRLVEYAKGLQNNENGKELYQIYQKDIISVTPQEAFQIFYTILQEGVDHKEILEFLDKVINAFYSSLSSYHWKKPENDNFIIDLQQENEAMVKKLEAIKVDLKEKSLEVKKQRLIPKIKELKLFDQHYIKKENILFPYMEKKQERFEGLTIMWALHDEVRRLLKETLEILEDEGSNEAEINVIMGKLFFAIHGLIKKEELILLPAASEVLTEGDWYQIHKQSLEYDFPFIKKDVSSLNINDNNEVIPSKQDEYRFRTETGALSLQQILLIFNALPVDITFVDENNRVGFFSDAKDRIFPRSPAIIGRDVKNCHPPDSVHVVNEIIESFRGGAKDTATFWISLKGRRILIQYFALRDTKGNYKGVLEVSQDITEIQKLDGEKRLLDW